MAIDFPNSPSTNDIFTSGGRSWQWTGTTWQAYVQALSNSSITNDLIANTTITSAKIANTTITAAQIANATITATQIANATVTSTQIANATITDTQIANATITYGKLALSNSVVNADISSSAAIAATKISGTAIVQSIVDAKGDLIVATADNTVARQGVGSNGQVLVADSGQTNGVAWVDPQTNRNVIINGAMQVAQRGTSTASITTSGYYTADRIYTFMSSLGTWTQSVEADAPTGSGLRKSFKMACTTADASPAAGDYLIIQNKLEGQNVQQFLKGTSSAKSFALSFWVKSFQTGTFIAELEDLDSSRSVSASYSISASATWEKKTIIFPADTTGAFDNDANASLSLNFWLGAGTGSTSGTLATTWGATVGANRAVGQTNAASSTSNYWQVTGVQLEAGSVATPFEFEDYGTTLAKCQRYYYVHATGFGQAIAMASWFNTTNLSFVFQHPVTMRTTPTSIQTSGSNYYALEYGGTTVYTTGPFGSNSFQPNVSRYYASGVAGGSTGAAGWIYTNNASALIALSAEL